MKWVIFIKRILRKAGVFDLRATQDSGSTGRCVVLITPDADRTLLTSLGISASISPDQIDGKSNILVQLCMLRRLFIKFRKWV